MALAPDDGKRTVDEGKRRNNNWETNHAVIRDAYVRLIQTLTRRPTIDEVCQMCGLCSKTVGNHIKKLKFEPIAHPLRVLTDDVLIAVANAAKDGNAASQKLWFQVMEGWRESNVVEQEIAHTVSSTPFSIKVHRAGAKGQ